MLVMAEIKNYSPSLERLRQDVPEGHSEESGSCLKDALHQAGYDIDLPNWVHIDDVPIVCGELGLKYSTGKGEKVNIKKSKPCIVGHVVQRRGGEEKNIGHWRFTDKPEELIPKIPSGDIFAIVTFPEEK